MRISYVGVRIKELMRPIRSLVRMVVMELTRDERVQGSVRDILLLEELLPYRPLTGLQGRPLLAEQLPEPL